MILLESFSTDRFCVLSAIALFVTSLIPTNLLLRFSGLLYVLALGLMASLHWFYDQTMFEQTHTKRWIRIGDFTIQPSEFMKGLYAFMVYLTLVYENEKPNGPLNLI